MLHEKLGLIRLLSLFLLISSKENIYCTIVTNNRDLDFLFLLYFLSVIDLFQGIISLSLH